MGGRVNMAKQPTTPEIAEFDEAAFAAKIEKSREVLRTAAEISKTYYHAPLVICYSGGKDSDVLLHLAETTLGKDDFEVSHNLTTVDAPETMKHMRRVFERLEKKGIATKINRKPLTMEGLIVKEGTPPTRLLRYCCSYFKEASEKKRMRAVGVRAAESANRKGRDVFTLFSAKKNYSLEHVKDALSDSRAHGEKLGLQPNDYDPYDCVFVTRVKRKVKTSCSPIYEWKDDEVWHYISSNKIEVNPLYAEGLRRIGCIGCPLSGSKNMLAGFERYPSYKRMYLRAFEKMIERRKEMGRPLGKWETAEDVMNWWIGGGSHGA